MNTLLAIFTALISVSMAKRAMEDTFKNELSKYDVFKHDGSKHDGSKQEKVKHNGLKREDAKRRGHHGKRPCQVSSSSSSSSSKLPCWSSSSSSSSCPSSSSNSCPSSSSSSCPSSSSSSCQRRCDSSSSCPFGGLGNGPDLNDGLLYQPDFRGVSRLLKIASRFDFRCPFDPSILCAQLTTAAVSMNFDFVLVNSDGTNLCDPADGGNYGREYEVVRSWSLNIDVWAIRDTSLVVAHPIYNKTGSVYNLLLSQDLATVPISPCFKTGEQEQNHKQQEQQEAQK